MRGGRKYWALMRVGSGFDLKRDEWRLKSGRGCRKLRPEGWSMSRVLEDWFRGLEGGCCYC